ncbi:MAG: hypothetical protein FJX53_10575 [Alphaproteobacteria bacterium]|nr:hypothetical protein [Alphaproteobacteria bacterium]
MLEPSRASADAPLQKSLSLVNDIPVPAGATLDIDRSIILGTPDNWTGRVLLRTGLTPTQAFSLYQREMPEFGWEPIMSVQAEISAMAYTRGERAATVQIEGRSLAGAMIAVTVAPRQQAGAPAAAPRQSVVVTPR